MPTNKQPDDRQLPLDIPPAEHHWRTRLTPASPPPTPSPPNMEIIKDTARALALQLSIQEETVFVLPIRYSNLTWEVAVIVTPPAIGDLATVALLRPSEEAIRKMGARSAQNHTWAGYGYPGGGPASLASSIVQHYAPDEHYGYQFFKEEHVANAPQPPAPFVIAKSTIMAWVERRRAGADAVEEMLYQRTARLDSDPDEVLIDDPQTGETITVREMRERSRARWTDPLEERGVAFEEGRTSVAPFFDEHVVTGSVLAIGDPQEAPEWIETYDDANGAHGEDDDGIHERPGDDVVEPKADDERGMGDAYEVEEDWGDPDDDDDDVWDDDEEEFEEDEEDDDVWDDDEEEFEEDEEDDDPGAGEIPF